jgi:hypothetical protein
MAAAEVFESVSAQLPHAGIPCALGTETAGSLGARKSGVRICPGPQGHQKVVPQWRHRTTPDRKFTRVCGLRSYAHEPWNTGCRICLLFQAIVFAGSSKLVPIDNSAAQALFLDKLLKMNAAKYTTTWAKKSFRDGLNPPLVAGSDAEALVHLRHTPGACSYVTDTNTGELLVVVRL